MNKHDQLKLLTKKVATLAQEYYVLDNPSVSDAEYDKLSDELIALENELGIVLPESPTNRVGGEILEGFEKVAHEFPLLSLAKSQTTNELLSWVEGVKKDFASAEFSLEHKFDGVSLSLTYQNGNLVLAATRGNGLVGENVTEQVKTIKSVPLQIPYMQKLVVVGEGLMLLSNLVKYNKKNVDVLKNARNAAAGAIRNLDPKQTAKRNLDFFAYHVAYCQGKQFSTQKDVHMFLKTNNFLVGAFFEVVNDFALINSHIQQVDNKRKNIDYLIDGIVLKLNQIEHREDIGKTSKFPKWAMAYKFEAEELSTVLKNITWSVGRTGKVTPIAEIEPVELSGATVQRATLNNFTDILRKKVRVGGRVFVRRSNEVIPEILGVAGDETVGEIPVEITTCPSCKTQLTKTNMNLFCPNYYGCEEQIVARFAHFSSRNAMNIEGLSEQTALQLYKELQITNFSQLYSLTKEQLLQLEGFKEKKAHKMIQAIHKSKNVKLSAFLFALGISEIGVKAAKDLAKRFGSLQNIISATFEEIVAISNFGEVMAKEIVSFFTDVHVVSEINNLISIGINIESDQTAVGNALQNKKIVLTGTLESLSREDATKLIEQAGGEVVGSVSGKTSFVVAGLNAGSKLDKAKSLGILVLNEEEFLTMVNAN